MSGVARGLKKGRVQASINNLLSLEGADHADEASERCTHPKLGGCTPKIGCGPTKTGVETGKTGVETGKTGVETGLSQQLLKQVLRRLNSSLKQVLTQVSQHRLNVKPRALCRARVRRESYAHPNTPTGPQALATWPAIPACTSRQDVSLQEH